MKPCRVTKVKMLFLVVVFVFTFHLFKFSAAILEKGLLSYYQIVQVFSRKFIYLNCIDWYEDMIDHRSYIKYTQPKQPKQL